MWANKDMLIGCYNISNVTLLERFGSFVNYKPRKENILSKEGYTTDNFEYRMKDETEKKKLNLYFWN